jgi:hypothetical protein
VATTGAWSDSGNLRSAANATDWANGPPNRWTTIRDPSHQRSVCAVRSLVLMSATDVIGTAANVATALGIIGVGSQLWLNRRQMVSAFERTFVDRYERIIRDVPLALLFGEAFDPFSDDKVLRAFFDYFELCEEELYFRRIGKVSRSTWCDWWEGIALNVRRPAFRTAWDHLRERVTVSAGSGKQVRATQFRLLRDAILAIDAGISFDPRS